MKLALYISNNALFFVLATFIFYCCIIPVAKHNDLSSFYSIICFKIISLVILHFNNCMWYSFKFVFYLLNLYYNFLFLQICLPFYFQNLSALCKLEIRKITMSENNRKIENIFLQGKREFLKSSYVCLTETFTLERWLKQADKARLTHFRNDTQSVQIWAANSITISRESKWYAMDLTLETTSIIVKYFRRNAPRMRKQTTRTRAAHCGRWWTIGRPRPRPWGWGRGEPREACVSAHNLAATRTTTTAATTPKVHRSARVCRFAL